MGREIRGWIGARHECFLVFGGFWSRIGSFPFSFLAEVGGGEALIIKLHKGWLSVAREWTTKAKWFSLFVGGGGGKIQ